MALSSASQEEKQLLPSTDHAPCEGAVAPEIYKWKQQLFEVVRANDQNLLSHLVQQQRALLEVIHAFPIIIGASGHDNASGVIRDERHPSDTNLEVGCTLSPLHTEKDQLDTPASPTLSYDLCAEPVKRSLPSQKDSIRNDTGFVDRHLKHATTRELGHVAADTFVAIMIILNALLIFVHGECSGWRISVKLGLQEDDGRWQHAGRYFFVLEHFFSAFFLAELIAALYVNGRKFFRDGFNWVDLIIVVCNSVDLYILTPLTLVSVAQLTVLRLLRILRLLRTLRIIRTVKLFKGLRLLVKAVFSCIMSLAWALVLVLIFTLMGGLLLNRLLEEEMLNDEADFALRHWIWIHYGTSSRAMYTMFEVTMSGCWPNYARPLLEISLAYALFFLVYVSFVVFAVTRVITAIFLKETLDTATDDAAMAIAEKSHKRAIYLKKLEDVFRHADESGDGELSREEFDKIMSDPSVKAYLSALELEVHESSLLFELLDDGDASITYDEFIRGVSRLKGQARTLDLVAMQLDLKKVLNFLHAPIEDLNSRRWEPGAELFHKTFLSTTAPTEPNVLIQAHSVLHFDSPLPASDAPPSGPPATPRMALSIML